MFFLINDMSPTHLLHALCKNGITPDPTEVGQIYPVTIKCSGMSYGMSSSVKGEMSQKKLGSHLGGAETENYGS